jgi:putative tricarboxylic transport membrane protein
MVGKYGEKYGDMIAGGAFFLFSVMLYRMSLDLKMSSISKFGGTVVPKAIAVIMAILSIILFTGGLLKFKNAAAAKGEPARKEEPRAQGFIPVVIVLAVAILYALLLQKIGFIIMTSLCLGAQMYVLSGFRTEKLLKFGIIAVVFSTGVYFLFVKLFYLMLPSGILG